MGIQVMQPACAWACTYALSPPLNCTEADILPPAEGMPASDAPELPSGPGWKVVASPSPACQAHSEFYLQTLALCLKSRCNDVSVVTLFEFWNDHWKEEFEEYGINSSLPASYVEVIASIKATQDKAYNATALLNYTAAMSDEAYEPYHQSIRVYIRDEITSGNYSFILFFTGALLPIALSLLRLLPWPSAVISKFNAYIVDPPLIDPKYAGFLSKLFVMPTRGQAIFIAYLFIINIVLSFVGFEVANPSAWYTSPRAEFLRYLANRTGILTMCNVPLVILYAGRNSVLLWATNWSRTTFLLLHRWMALICTIHAVIHSCVFLYIARTQPGWEQEPTEKYWIWGSVGTVAFSVLIISSVRPIRAIAYELFIAAHIAVSIVALYGSYHHIVDKYEYSYGYQNWIIISIAVWAFDRVIRLVRIARHGVKRAFVTYIDEDYYRIDIPGISAVGHAYLHFPTVSKWRIWESHPFSIAAVTYCNKISSTLVSRSNSVTEIGTGKSVMLDSPVSPVTVSDTELDLPPKELGIVLFVKRQKGITAKLMTANWGLKGLPVLVEGSYGHSMLSPHVEEVVPTSEFPNLICIAGGVGITGVLPALASFHSLTKPTGTKKLYWGVRTVPLLHSLENMLGFQVSSAETKAKTPWYDVDVTLSVGQRLDLRSLLERDLKSNKGGTLITVCGPVNMTDDVRQFVSGISRHSQDGKVIVTKLLIEAFDW